MLSLQHIILYLVVVAGCYGQDLNPKKFPKDFLLGTASASYQVEGAWNEDGKGENIWDRVCHTVPSPIDEGATADIACDSYHKYKEDVALMKDLGVSVYRFSISWSRILPTGYPNSLNQAGINYYKNLIKELRNNGIEPLVTMYHWDLPQPLQDIGGWPNELIIERYVDYARVLFEQFGDDVKYWLTFNEPKQTCQLGYGSGVFAPLIKSPGIGEYLCTHNLLKAHAGAWHLYDRQFRAKQKGYVSITVDTVWAEPDSNNATDLAAAERYLQFVHGWYVHPILKGDYPWQMKQFIAERSAKQGFERSRLPEFTEREIQHINGTADFLGLNFYNALMVKNRVDEQKSVVGWEADSEVDVYFKDEWPTTASSWLRVTPWGFRKILNWLKKTYGDIPIIVTENGVSDDGSSLEDDIRINYYQTHLSALRDALDDGVNVFGYTAWSIMDNFEWMRGYTERFGLYSVNFTDPNRPRTPKKSVGYYKQFLATRCVLTNSECTEA